MFEATTGRTPQIQRSYLAGRDAGQALADDRKQTLEMLAAHGRLSAFMALAHGRSSCFVDYMKMRGAFLAGGLHRVRLMNSLEPAGGSGMPGKSRSRATQ